MGERLRIFGASSPTREFLNVGDAAEGVVLAAERYNKSASGNLDTRFRDRRQGFGDADQTISRIRKTDCNCYIGIKCAAKTQIRHKSSRARDWLYITDNV